ncbi:hypothetical protein [Pseudoalteromonas aurantia]|uniref:Uncharacterized protein n=1 Tax=Pseudoalteromonas aurantia 208 TaxID=1314867 RepID=A0ABR9EC69_9GAMM|nr:hypothetical protein [Pseudoalteromonas aurantia]MBE0368560.1 hypothetical protein [Pseudoalteromonas aurantia 208]
MFNKVILASACLFSLSANATVISKNFSPILKNNYPLHITEPDRASLDQKNYSHGYLASYAQGYVDISKYLLTVDQVCFEVDTQYSGSGSTPGTAGVNVYNYFMYANGSRSTNKQNGSASSLARPTFSHCFELAEGYANSFVNEGKIAFTPYTTNENVAIADVRVSVTGLSKISGDIVTIDAASNVVGNAGGEAVMHPVESGVTYALTIIDNTTALSSGVGSYSTLGVSYLDASGNSTLKTLDGHTPVYLESMSDLSLFLIGSDTSSQGQMSVNIKKVNFD